MGGDEPFSIDSYPSGYSNLYASAIGDYRVSVFAKIEQELVKIPEKYLPESAIAQADLSQTDTAQPDYVKGVIRQESLPEGYPYDNGITETILVNNQTITGFSSWDPWKVFENQESVKFDIVEGRKYIVNWDGTDYETIGHTFKDGSYGFDYIGNVNYTNIGISTGGSIPFSIINYTNDEREAGNYTHIVTESTAESHVISVTEHASNIDKINVEFLPEGYPHKEIIDGALFNGSGITFNDGRSEFIESPFGHFIIGQKYTVVWDGVEYSDLIAFEDNGDATIGAAYKNTNDDMPFNICTWDNYMGTETPVATRLGINTHSDAASHNVSIYGTAKIIKTIDIDYLPENLHNPIGRCGPGIASEIFNSPYNNATGNYSHAEGSYTDAIGHYSHTEGYGTTASGYYAHAEGYNAMASGDYSHAEGSGTTASGIYSHAEGCKTIASGDYSHAEGAIDTHSCQLIGDANSTTYELYSFTSGVKVGCPISYNGIEAKIIAINNRTITVSKTLSENVALNKAYATIKYGCASGKYSHSEGDSTIASGNYSHAEGVDTVAGGLGSHAEGGNTTASGECSHAEGSYTTASGSFSHAEGYKTAASGNYSHIEGYETTAQGKSQHVQGEYNILDSQGSATTRGTYAHIVGNGTSSTYRSNAHTLDWDGNAWFAGDVYVGSTGGKNKDDGSKKLVTVDEMNAAIAAAIEAAFANIARAENTSF